MLRIENVEEEIKDIEFEKERLAISKKIYELAVNNEEAALLEIKEKSGLSNHVFGWNYCIDSPITQLAKEKNKNAWELLCKIFDYKSTIYYSMVITNDFEGIKRRLDPDNLGSNNIDRSKEEMDRYIFNNTFGIGYAICGCIKTGYAKQAKQLIDLVNQYSPTRAKELTGTAINQSIETGDIEALKLFHQVEQGGDKSLEIALYARKGDINQVNQLLENQQQQETAIIHYAKNKHFTFASELLMKSPSTLLVNTVIKIYFEDKQFNAINQLIEQEWVKPYLNLSDLAAIFIGNLVNGYAHEFASRVLKAMAMINHPELREMMAANTNSSIFIAACNKISDADIEEAGILNRLMIEHQVNYRGAKDLLQLKPVSYKPFTQSQQVTLFKEKSAANVDREPLVNNQHTATNSEYEPHVESTPCCNLL